MIQMAQHHSSHYSLGVIVLLLEMNQVYALTIFHVVLWTWPCAKFHQTAIWCLVERTVCFGVNDYYENGLDFVLLS